MAAIAAGFLAVGIALPVLPLHVQQDLGFDPFMVGVVAGSQFAAALVSRIWAGGYSDRRGAKRGVLIGLLAAGIAGALYLASLACASPDLSVAVLLMGRAVLGGAESFIITGGVSWGLGLVQSSGSGKVITCWLVEHPASFRSLLIAEAVAVGAQPGTCVFRRDDASSGLSGVVSGAIGVEGGHRRQTSLLGHVMRPGEWFGIKALLHSGPRELTYRAIEPTRLLFISRTRLVPLMQADAMIAVRVGQLAEIGTDWARGSPVTC